ncbi:hypothetical protein GGF42_005852 [Coemansia sp. RSA 2424]|nr:hypothetical protein GGF42_005852 [Coemansia sp. RSA 2424]
MDVLSASQRASVELIQAHIYVLQVKREVARGLHTGSPTRGGSTRRGDSRGDVRATQVALLGKAFNHACPGLLLNLLLDWNTGATLVSPEFLDSACIRYLARPEQIRDSVDAGRRLYELVMNDSAAARGGTHTTTGFVDALWGADNYEAALTELAPLAAMEEKASITPGSMVSSLAVQLMQCAGKAGHLQVVTRVFAEYREWLDKSPVAYNILLHPRALAYDIPGVVALLKLMRDNRVFPDAVTWTTIMNGMCVNGRIEQAMKLFALHLEFLPQQQQQQQQGEEKDGVLYAPMNGLWHAGSPNLWQSWYANTTRAYSIHPYFDNLIREMAECSRQEIQVEGSSRQRQRRKMRMVVPPWLPTLATHKVLLKHMGRVNRVREVAEYYELLKRYWPQYAQWAGPPRHAGLLQSDGLRGIERMVRGCLAAQNTSELRNIFGLVSDTTPDEGSPHYYDYCERIWVLAIPTAKPPTTVAECDKGRMWLPDRMVFNKSLHAYALAGDIRTVLSLMEKYRELHDIATWTELVCCVLTQISNSGAYDPRMLRPLDDTTDWVDFLLDLDRRLSGSGMRFTQVTFGQIVQAAVERGEFSAVPRIVEYMDRQSFERFNVDMLRMVLELEFPFELKCALVKNSLMGMHRVRPDFKLLVLVVKLAAKSPRDLTLLPPIVKLFEIEFGLGLGDSEYRYLIEACASLELPDMVQYWTALRYKRTL